MNVAAASAALAQTLQAILLCAYAGRKDDAQKQFALAAGLDLSAADKAELASRMQSKI